MTDPKSIKYIILFDEEYQPIPSEKKVIFDKLGSSTGDTGETGKKGLVAATKAIFERIDDPNKTNWNLRTQVQYLIKNDESKGGLVVYEPTQNVRNIYELFLYKYIDDRTFNYDIFKGIQLSKDKLLKVNYDNSNIIPDKEINNTNYFYHIYLNYVTSEPVNSFEKLNPNQQKYFVIKTTNYDNVIIEITDKKISQQRYTDPNVFFHYVKIRKGTDKNPDIVTVRFNQFDKPIVYGDLYTTISPIPVRTTTESNQENLARLTKEYSLIYDEYNQSYTKNPSNPLLNEKYKILQELQKRIEEFESKIQIESNLHRQAGGEKKYYSFKKGVLNKL